MTPQYQFLEFKNLLFHIVDNNEPNCKPETISILTKILYTDYPYQEDDIEFLSDMINYYIRKIKYTGKKQNFHIRTYLDKACQEMLYLTEFLPT